MSVVLAGISALRKTLNEKLALTRDFSFTAGEDLSTGQMVAIGSDGKAYKNSASATTEVLEEVVFSTNKNIGGTTYTAGQYSFGEKALILLHNYSTDNNTSNEDQLSLYLTYADNNDQLQAVKTDIHAIDGYSNSGSNWTYNTIQVPYMQKIDDTHFLITWLQIYHHYDGSSHSYNNYMYGVIATIDIDSNTINLSSKKSTSYCTGSAVNSYVPSSFKILPINSTTVFGYACYSSGYLMKLVVDPTNNYDISIATVNTSLATASCSIYNSIVDLGTGGVMMISSNFSNKWVIPSDSATDFTQVDVSDGESAYTYGYSFPLDIQKILVYDKGNLYVFEYNTDGSLANKKKVNLDFDSGLLSKIYFNGQYFLPYKDTNDDYYLTLSTNLTGDKVYTSTATDSVRLNHKEVIIKISIDTDGNYSATNLGIISNMGKSTSILPAFTKIGNYFVTANDGYRSYTSCYNILKKIQIKTDGIIKKKVELYAKEDATKDSNVTCFTNKTPVALSIDAGTYENGFVGIGNGYALKEVK
jgi:hypothetical protein